MDFQGLLNAGQGMLDAGMDRAQEAGRSAALGIIQQNPGQLDTLIEGMGEDANNFYRALGPMGQENLKSLIAQDPAFLPALDKAMAGGGEGGASSFTNLPAGMVNTVLAEANSDADFRTQLVSTLESDPSQLMNVVGQEAGQDTSFGLKLGGAGISAAMNGELGMDDLGAGGGLLSGFASGMMGGLMGSLQGLIQGLMGMFGQLFDSLKGMLGDDMIMQSVGDAPPGQRPADALTAGVDAAAESAGVAERTGTVFTPTDDGGAEAYTGAPTIGADTPMAGPAVTAGVAPGGPKNPAPGGMNG